MGAVDFLPEDYVAAKSHARANLLCFGLFLVVMVGIGWAFVINQQRDAEVALLDEKVNETILRENRKLTRMRELNQKKASMLEKARVTGLLLQRVPRSLVLAELTNAMPKQCSWVRWKLTSVKARQRKSRRKLSRLQARLMARRAAEQPEQMTVKLTIEGISPTDIEVSKFMTAIKSCPLFDNVNLISTEEHKREQEILRRFRVQIELAKDAGDHVEAIAAKQKERLRMFGKRDVAL